MMESSSKNPQQFQRCPYCGDEMVYDGLSYLWHCLQPECPIDDLSDEELRGVDPLSPEDYSKCPYCEEFSGRPLIAGYNYCRICDARW